MRASLKDVDWIRVGLGIATALGVGGTVSQSLDLGAAGTNQELCCSVARVCDQNGFLEGYLTTSSSEVTP